MRIAVMGTGGVGGYFGGLLARNGEDVTFIAPRQAPGGAVPRWAARRERPRRFQDRTHAGDGDPRAVGPVDVVLFATKTYQLDEAAGAMRPLVGPETVVVPLHNGVDAAERTGAIVGEQHVLGGLCYVGSMIAAPGVIRQESPFRRVVVGEMPWSPNRGTVTARVQELVDTLAAAGATAEASTDIQAARWTKFAFIAPFSGVGAVTRAQAGADQRGPGNAGRAPRRDRRGGGRGRGRGRAAAGGTGQDAAFCDGLAPHITASMQRDILDGRPSELESMIGVVVRKGDAHRVPVPTFRFLYASLLPQERRARGLKG